MKLSPQQAAFVDFVRDGRGSCVLEAVAGAGKTTTLIEAVKQAQGTVALLAFNKKIAVEIGERLKANGISTMKAEAGTVHSFGFRAYRRTYKNVTVDRKKLETLLLRIIPDFHPIASYRSMVTELVSLAKQRALGVIGKPSDVNEWRAIADHFGTFETDRKSSAIVPELDIIHAAQQLLELNNRTVDVIDFDDQVYMPLVLGLKFWQFDIVMIDEAQDTNPARREIVRRLLKPRGRVIAVGDRHQAIYGFTGADNDSLDIIKQEFNAIDLPLTTTYRCPQAVVAFARQWVSHITAHESAPVGVVSQDVVSEFLKRTDLDGNAAVLCRNTKPLVSLAMTLIRHRIACKVEGRDIAANLKKLIGRWRVKSLHKLMGKLDEYKERETQKLIAKQQDAKVQTIEDTVETIRVIIDQCLEEKRDTIDAALAFIDDLFADDVRGILVLSTIHKSKGREWERVYWLDRNETCPSKWAKKPWELEQETNLCYVAATRAKSELIQLDNDADEHKPAQKPRVAVEPELTYKGTKTVDQRKADKARRARERRERRKQGQDR